MIRSNKLIIGLLIAIFIIPLGLFMAFKKMAKEDNYTVIYHNAKDYIANGKTGHYSVVKITVPDFKHTNSRKILTCHLHSAKEGHYEFKAFDIMDSISVSNERDTLFIEYVSKSHRNVPRRYFVYHNIDLYLPDMKDIIVTRATLQMDSINAISNPDIGIHLNNAIFQLGYAKGKKDNSNPALGGRQEYGIDKHRVSTILRYRNLSISAEASDINLGYHIQIDTLSLAIGTKSKLSIANGFQAHQVIGTVSNQTTIISNIRTIKMLNRLNIDKD